jgi:type IV secretion system protein VirB2
MIRKRNDILLIAALAMIGLAVSSDLAWATAATFQPLNTAMTAVLQFMTGTFATTAATVAVAAVGFLALTSRIPWSWCFSVVIGVALIFGAAQIVQSLTSGMGGG